MTKRKVGRPLIEINWSMLEKLASIQCTGEEMAGVLNVDYKTIERACKRENNSNFGEWIEQKRAGGKASLRKMQYDAAKTGNTTMLVWLGKNWLGQTDKEPEDEDKLMRPVIVNVSNKNGH